MKIDQQFLKELIARFKEAEVLGLSAQLAYFFLLSLFPFLLFLITLLAYLPVEEGLVLELLAEYLPQDVTLMIEQNLSQILHHRSGGMLSLGAIGTLWSASNGFNALRRSFNKAYGVKKPRNFFLSRIIAIGLMLIIILAIIVALLLPVFGNVIGNLLIEMNFVSSTFETLWNSFRWIMSSVLFFILFYVLYKLGPNYEKRKNYVICGTFFATVTWQLTSFGFSYYVETLGNFTLTYGSLGTVIVLMIWFYLSGIIITTGGVINAQITKRKNEKTA